MTRPDRSLDTVAVTAWINEDPDPATREELTALLTAHEAGDDEAAAALTDAFSDTLTLGADGLRGPLGAGPNRMNRAVVIRAAAGLAAYLRETLGEGFTVVIGYDARRHSGVFARDTASVITGAGGRAVLFDRPCPTPTLAFALRRLEADAAVMVAASRTPPQINGFTIYLGGRAVTGPGQGAQIASPYDSAIAERIEAVGDPTETTEMSETPEMPMPDSGWETLGEEIIEDYTATAAKAARMRAAAPLKIVLTALHGVGGRICRDALGRVGLDVIVVPEQFDADPGFPTVASPDPEEAGTLDLPLAQARDADADLVIAIDPDAGCCCAAIPDEHVTGGWRRLTGDELGTVLGEQAAELAAFTGTGILANSIVSSRMLRKIAQAHGLGHRNALPGFKWISRVPGLVFGYEEALGYCVDPASVRDKDGISASVRLAVLASVLKQQGRSIADLLDRLAREHGLHATGHLSVSSAGAEGAEDASFISTTMDRLRAGGVPASLAGSPVVDVFDLLDGASDGNGGKLPPTDGLIIKTAANDRIVVHPSGTGPRLACHCEVVVPVGVEDPVELARRTAADRLEALKTDMRGVLGA